VLLLLSQLPQDPAGGAVRSLRTICELLAAAPGGAFRVAALGTTATDHLAGIDARRVLRDQGVEFTEQPGARAQDRAVLRFVQRGIDYTILDSGHLRSGDWNVPFGRQFDVMLDGILIRLKPDVVLTMGANHFERERQRRCRAAGAAVVLGVRQHGYYDLRAFEHVDDALMPSEFLVSCYEKRIGYQGTAIPPPIEPEDVVPATRKPIFFTFVNPSLEKGVMLFARLAEEVSIRRPDIPFMVVESRGLGGTLIGAGMAGGFDLRRHKNILVSPGVPQPKSFYAATRVLLAPSVWEEPSGRVASEALVCGIPPMVSDRGGLAETCQDAGFVLPLPKDLRVETKTPVSAEAARPWVEMVIRLADDGAFYEEACAKALRVGATYRAEALADRYIDYFHLSKRVNK
jgi:glycosyltransferase involved in cell wall biosynthesis